MPPVWRRSQDNEFRVRFRGKDRARLLLPQGGKEASTVSIEPRHKDKDILDAGRSGSPFVHGEHRHLYWTAFAVILALAFAARLYLVLVSKAVKTDAASYYLPIAEAIQLDKPLPEKHVRVPVLYSQLSGLTAKVMGDVELSSRIVSLFGGMMACVFVFLLARKLFGPYAALAAMSLAGFHPYLCHHSAATGVDSLAVGWFCGIAFCLVAYLLRPSLWRAALLGVFLGLMTLTRAEGFLYVPVALLLMALFPVAGRFRLDGRRIRDAILLVVVAGVLCLPRVCQVHRATGLWVGDERWVATPKKLLRVYAGLTSSPQTPAKRGHLLQRITPKEPLDVAESVAAAFGPAALPIGLLAILYRRRRALRVEWVPAILIICGALIVTVGSRASRRYLLPMGAVWQIWGGVGLLVITSLLGKAIARQWPRVGSLHRLPSVALLAAAIALMQLPYILIVSDRHAQAAERAMGEWIRAEYGTGRRILAFRPTAVWHARGKLVPTPRKTRRSRETAELVHYALERDSRLIVVGKHVDKWCGGLAADVKKGVFAYGRIAHVVGAYGDGLWLLEIVGEPPPASQTSQEE